MKLVLPIICMTASVIALVLSILGIISALITNVFVLFGAFAIVIVISGFTISVIDCGLSFALVKSKLCIAAGIISAIAMFTSMASLIILIK